MAFSSSVSPNPPFSFYSSSSYYSLHFLLLRPKTNFSFSPKTLTKLTISSSSQRLAELETDHRSQPQQHRRVEVVEPRKKRKPKPSFLAQIQAKWSAKVGSQRDKFPWQERKPELENETESATESATTKSSRLSESASSGSRVSVVSSAPWAHGGETTKPFKPHVRTKKSRDSNYDNSNGRRFDDNITVVKPSSEFEFDRELDSQNNEVQVENWNDDEDGTSVSSGSNSESGDRDMSKWKWKRSNTVVAKTTLPEHELKRLRNVSLRMVGMIKVGARGITEEVVDTIRGKWELEEVVKIKFEEPLSLNMRRTHGILENKTGGLVIWRSGSSLVLYRGMTYNLPCVQSFTKQKSADTAKLTDPEDVTTDAKVKDSVTKLEYSTHALRKLSNGQSEEEIEHMNDLNELLDELGPRFEDWLGRRPLPVDADLLPQVVPDYKTPFRLLPYGVRLCVGNGQMTNLRRTARMMPPHFALGRNRELQGLAKAMVKLWGKSPIAKIAIKRGVENTRNERMAEELKMLTGGTLVSRNKEYIVFYRGNDFLPPDITETLKERRKLRDLKQDEEEQARNVATGFIVSKTKASIEQSVAGTLAETKAATVRWGKQPSGEEVDKMIEDSSLARRKAIIRDLERRFIIAKGNLATAERTLAKVQEDLNLSDPPDDLETITDEERILFRKMGLSMKPYLLLGRRGFYDGTVQNIHLHWKHRELVKVIMKAKHLEHVKHVAICLEVESGGVLVSVDKTLKGYAIVIYRGKNYRQPDDLRPRNLLTKRQALARSKEVQRREALRRHVSDLKERIELLKCELEEPRNGKVIDDRKSLESMPMVEHSFSSDSDAVEDNEDDTLVERFDLGDEYEDS